jgi:hypothetical protein
MKTFLTIIFLSYQLFSQTKINAFQKLPNLEEKGWNLVKNELRTSSNTYLFMYKHEPTLDSAKRTIEPVISFIIQKTKQTNLILFSINKRSIMNKNYSLKVEKVFINDSTNQYFSTPNSIGYKATMIMVLFIELFLLINYTKI